MDLRTTRARRVPVLRAALAACALAILTDWAGERRSNGADEAQAAAATQRQALGLQSKELAQRSSELLDHSRYLESLEVNKQRLEINRRLYPAETYPKGHEEIVVTLLDLAQAARATLKYDQAAEYAQLALQMAQRLFPPSQYPSGHEIVARCLAQLGNLASRQGDLAKAIQYHQEAAGILERRWQQEPSSELHHLLALELTSLASDLTSHGQFQRASSCFQKVATLWDRFFQGHELLQADGNELRVYLAFLNRLGDFRYAMGETGEAIAAHEKAVTVARAMVARSKSGLGNEDLVMALYLLGSDYRFAGRYREAREQLQAGLTTAQTKFNARDPFAQRAISSCLIELAEIELQIGEPSEAKRLSDQAVSHARSLFPRNQFPEGNRELAVLLNRHAAILAGLGDLETARRCAEEGLKMRRHFAATAGSAEDQQALAASLSRLGDWGASLRCAEEALDIHRKLYPKTEFPNGHPQLAVALQNAAFMCGRGRDYQRALTYSTQAVELWRARTPSSLQPDEISSFATALQQLSFVYRQLKDFEQAERLLSQAADLLARLPEDEPIFKNSLSLLLSRRAVLLALCGKPAAALESADQCIEMVESIFARYRFPDGHPELASALVTCAAAIYFWGDPNSASRILERATRMRQRLLFRHLPGLSEAEALNLVADNLCARDLLLSAWRRTSRPIPELYEILWAQRGIVQRAMSYRQRLLQAARSPDSAQALAEYRSVSRKLARLLLYPDKGSADVQRESMETITQRKEELERALARSGGQLPEWMSIGGSSPSELARLCPPGCAFVEFLRYMDISPSARGISSFREAGRDRYAAFVVQRGGPVKFLDLGESQAIDAAVESFRRAIRHRVALPLHAADLRRLVWTPVEKLVGAEAKTLYICPDSLLTGVPWGALPSGEGDRLLLEKYAVALVPSGQFLVEQIKRTIQRTSSPARLLAIGDVAFGRQPTNADGAGKLAQRSAVRGHPHHAWRPLAATAVELQAIAEAAKPRQVVLLRGADASTGRVAQELPKATWAHFATHGFFADAEFRSAIQSRDAAGVDQQLLGTSGKRVSAAERNPLLLSGLVLAGANLPNEENSSGTPRDDDGILTAEAISYLPLKDLELVVLSACDTGLGDVAGGEGVLGLQRAFHIAGAKNVIASLWQVEDEATSALMKTFYHKLWREGKTPLESLREAQLAVCRSPELAAKGLQHPRRIDLSKTSPLPSSTQGPSPARKLASLHLWAGFVLSGFGQ